MRRTLPVGSRSAVPPARAVPPDRPARHLEADVHGRPALVIAVVPLHEVVASLRDIAEARQPARLRRPLEGARQHQGEAAPAQVAPDVLGLQSALLGQGDVCSPGVAALEAPFRLTVAYEHDLVGHRASLTGPGLDSAVPET